MLKNIKKNTFLDFKPIQKFISGIGKEVKDYFKGSKGTIVALGDDGFFYGIGLYQWLKKEGFKVELTFLDEEEKTFEKEKLKGRKVLMVDNDIVTGRSYRKTMRFLRGKMRELKIKDIKYAVLCDRVGVADFSVETYPLSLSPTLENLDEIDLEIIASLSKNGRKSLAKLAKKVGLTPAGVKKRVERLKESKILKICALINLKNTYTSSASIGIEAEPQTIARLISKLKKTPYVYHLNRVSGGHDLIVSIIGENPQKLEKFIDKEIRSEKGIRHVEVNMGDLPLVPEFFPPPSSLKELRKFLWG